MTRSGNRGLRAYLATLAAVAAAVSGLWLPFGARAAVAAPAVPTWSTLSPPARPPALAYAAEAFDPANQTVVLFGGVDSGGSLSAATWIWNGTTWSEAPAQFSGPAPRELASLAYFPGASGQTQGQLILFGGEGAGGTPLGDTWAWNGQSWVALTQTSTPPARFGASLAPDATGNLVLFGGTGSAPAVHSPLSAGPASTSASSSSSSSSSSSTSPAVSADATGSTGTVAGSVTPAAASTPAITAAANAAAPGSAQTAVPNAATPNTPTANAATPNAAATGTSGTLTRATPATEGGAASASPNKALPATTPAATQPVTATSAATNSGTTTLDDTWIWNGSAWSQPNITTEPPARTDAALVWDPQIGQTVLFGGSATPTAGGATPIDDTWVWSGSAWTRLNPATSPPARFDAASGSAGSVGGALLIGGSSGSAQLGDAWNFDGDTWSRLVTTGALTARSGAAAAGNPASDSLMVFGGLGFGGNLDDTDVLTPAPPVRVVPTPPTTQSSPGPSPTGSSPTGSSSSSTPPPGTKSPTAPAQTQPTSGSTVKPTSPASGTSPSSAPTSATRGATTTTIPPTTSPTVGPGTGARITSGTGSQQAVAGTQGNPSPLPARSPGPKSSPVTQTVHTGSLVTVLGSGFKPGAMVTITFHSRPLTVGRAIAGPQGTFSATVTVPLNATPGHHHLEASGMGPHGRMNILLTPLLVVGSIAPSSTGTPKQTTIIMVAVSVLLPIGTWVFLGVWSRRRHRPAANP